MRIVVITIVIVGVWALELPLHYLQQDVVRRDEIAREGMRKRVVWPEVQLEQGILLRRASPERSVDGRLSAERVDRLADRLGANVPGILYGVEVGGRERISRRRFLRISRRRCLGCIVWILHFKIST